MMHMLTSLIVAIILQNIHTYTIIILYILNIYYVNNHLSIKMEKINSENVKQEPR